jgi:hypothetical protein
VIYVTLPTLTSIHAVDGARVSADDEEFRGTALDVQVSGDSRVHLNVILDSLGASCTGGSNLDVRHSRVRILKATSSDGCELFTTSFEASQVELDINGGAEVAIGARDSLIARITDGSDLQLRGERPRFLEIEVSSGSRVRECPKCD